MRNYTIYYTHVYVSVCVCAFCWGLLFGPIKMGTQVILEGSPSNRGNSTYIGTPSSCTSTDLLGQAVTTTQKGCFRPAFQPASCQFVSFMGNPLATSLCDQVVFFTHSQTVPTRYRSESIWWCSCLGPFLVMSHDPKGEPLICRFFPESIAKGSSERSSRTNLHRVTCAESNT